MFFFFFLLLGHRTDTPKFSFFGNDFPDWEVDPATYLVATEENDSLRLG
jgi:hypothetical protein